MEYSANTLQYRETRLAGEHRMSKRVAVLNDLDYGHARRMLRGIRQWAQEAGDWELRRVPGNVAVVPGVRRWGADGIIGAIYNRALAEAVLELNIPVVNSSVRVREIPIPIVASEGIDRVAAEHFLERGIRSFGFYGHADHSTGLSERFPAELARRGYGCSCYEAPTELIDAELGGAAPPEEGWSAEAAGVRDWLRSLAKPAGVLAYNDVGGVELTQVCAKAGIHVPDEVAVLGVDDDDALCDWAVPPLSSVRSNSEREGYEAGRLLTDLLAGGRRPERPTRCPVIGVVTRRSTDTLAVDDEHVAAALRYIRAHGDEGIGVADVLGEVPVSRRRLEQRFRRAVGRTIHAEIRRVRIAAACRLLAETDLPLAGVAERSGFRTPQYFSQSFRKATGRTPAAYRRAFRHG
jgi:LacI family transcriptional regulator